MPIFPLLQPLILFLLISLPLDCIPNVIPYALHLWIIFVTVQNPLRFVVSCCAKQRIEKSFSALTCYYFVDKMMIFYLYTKLVDNPQPSTFYPLHFRLLRRFWIYLWAFVLSNLILIHRHFAKRISQQIRFFSAFPLQYKHKIPRKEGGLNAS